MRAGASNRAGALPNVLIVDDEQDILLTFKQFLSGQPVNVEVFADPVQLLGRLAQVGPSYYDLAILDIRMPKLSGFQVHQILTALKPNIKTLFISALDYAGEVIVGLRWIDKEEDLIRKPVSRESLVYAVNRKIKACLPKVPAPYIFSFHRDLVVLQITIILYRTTTQDRAGQTGMCCIALGCCNSSF